MAFGNTPYVEIDRSNVEFDIVWDYSGEHSVSNAYMIMGVMGSGKTVYITLKSLYYVLFSHWFLRVLRQL